MNWNDRIRKVRKERRMRREDVVETMRAYLPDGETVSTRTLASWELGDSEPKISHAIALAKTYQIENVTELFFDDPAEAALTPEGRELLRKYRELLLESPRYTHRRPHLNRYGSCRFMTFRYLPVPVIFWTATAMKWLTQTIPYRSALILR